jgi:hypothetical protein
VNPLIVFRMIGLALLMFLPGAWIAFGLPLKDLPYWSKLFLGIVMTPVMLAGQFFLIRWLGASFDLTAAVLVIVNLPALYLVLRQRIRLSVPDRRTVAAAFMVFLIIIGCIAPFLLDPQKRLYSWEAWMHADIIYSLANGNLPLEDPELVGVALAYPWAGHIYQGVLSYLSDTPAVTDYIWLNLVWLFVIFGFSAGIVAELGGNRLSQVTVATWLSFGVNIVGYVLSHTIPSAWADAHHVLLYIDGDNRYTPWLDLVVDISQMYFGMGLFAATTFLSIRQWPEDYKRYYLTVVGLLLCGLGIIYPVLLPPALAVVGTRAIVPLIQRVPKWPRGAWRELAGFAAVLVIAGLVTWLWVKFLTGWRTGQTLINLNDRHFIGYESTITVVVISPLLLGLLLAARRCWRENRNALIILGFGALASCILYVLFDIPWWRNEYKFIFTAAICLAPFPSLALEPIFDRLGRLAIPSFALLTVILAAPFADKVYQQAYYYYTRPGPPVDASHFDLRLDDGQPLSKLLNTIRDRTPVDSLLVLENTSIHFPTLTQRQLYVAPAETTPKPGILVTNDEMLTLVKGYPKELVEKRRAVVRGLFESDDTAQMAASLNDMLAFHRPLVLLLDEQQQASLRAWLVSEGMGESLYQGDGLIVWLVTAGATVPNLNSAPIGAQSRR